jgi:hypothetical protein
MTDRMTFRTFPTAFKLAAIKRLEAGEAVLPLARELGVSRKLPCALLIFRGGALRHQLGRHASRDCGAVPIEVLPIEVLPCVGCFPALFPWLFDN